MKYRLVSAFFCQGVDPSDSEPARRAKMVGILHSRASTAQVQLFVDIEGPPGTTDSATAAARLADGRYAQVGPEAFSFSREGRAGLVFFFNSMPMTSFGSVTAHLLFAGEKAATPICSMQIVPPPIPDEPTAH